MYASIAQQPSFLRSHPVIQNRAHIPTPPIKRADMLVQECVLERDPGIAFAGHSRSGKTFAITVLGTRLKFAFPGLPVFATNAKKHTGWSEVTFFAELLKSCTGMNSGRETARDLRTQVIGSMFTAAQAGGWDRIVLFVDEAQNWAQTELTCLRDLSNDLESFHEISLVVILFGTPTLTNLRQTLLREGRQDLIGRFLVTVYEFGGIAFLVDLQDVFQCYDDVATSEYPENSGTPYSAAFLPMAFESGWRLEREAALCFDAFKEVAERHGSFGQVGMKWIAKAIRRFLVDGLKGDHPGYKGTKENWTSAVARSGFEHTLGLELPQVSPA